MNANPDPTAPAARWEKTRSTVAAIRTETARVIVGQDSVVELMLTSLMCNGHCLVVGVPGLAKTLLVSTLGRILGLQFQRIQFTPDLMPADILGSEILQTAEDGSRRFQFARGPVFANLILADEINRTPPKTQAALLEAMQEKQVTAAGRTHTLPHPFLVFATQNPIEHEGTYPLPEAQLDRFLFLLRIDYPSIEEEEKVVRRMNTLTPPQASAVLDANGLIELQSIVHEVPMPDHVLKAILRLVHQSRPSSSLADAHVKQYVDYGAGPRASQALALASQALALLRGQAAASLEEVRAVAPSVLRHRLIPNYNATGEGMTSDDLVTHLLGRLG